MKPLKSSSFKLLSWDHNIGDLDRIPVEAVSTGSRFRFRGNAIKICTTKNYEEVLDPTDRSGVPRAYTHHTMSAQ